MRHRFLLLHVARHQSQRAYHLNRGVGQMVVGFLGIFFFAMIIAILLYGA